jgi:D-sedoheptulose 7-phosphate isomerase
MNARNFILSYLQSVESILREVDPDGLEQIIEVIFEAYKEDRQVFIMGNGGGAATAMHFTCDLSKTAIVPGKRRMRVHSLSDNTSLVTAWANDTNYTNIFGEQLVNHARKGDVVIGFTASGMSINIVNGIALANELGCKTVAFVGFDGGTVSAIADHVLHIRSNSYQHIEDVHLLLAHVITNAIQERTRSDEGLDLASGSDAVQERVRRIEYARQQLGSEPSLDRRIKMIPDQVCRTIGFDRAMIYTPEDGGLVLRGSFGGKRSDGAKLELDADLYECESFRVRKALPVAELNGRSPTWLGPYEGLASYAVAPIVRGDDAVGVLVGGFTDPGRSVGAGELQLLQIFAYNIRAAIAAAGPVDPPTNQD